MKTPLLLILAVVVCWSCICIAAPRATPDVSPFPDGTDQQAESSPPEASSYITFPGPLRPLLRMAGMGQHVEPGDVLPLLGRNVFTLGYERGRPTEFLILLSRYVQQAKELALLAGSDGVIRVSNCDDAKPLLQVLGYRTPQGCGQKSGFVETADPQRAFLTSDSGFPLPELERALQGGKPFAYSFAASRLPVLFSESDWTSAIKKRDKSNRKDLVDAFLRNPSLARLYWAMSRMDPGTASVLRHSTGIGRLIPHSAALDFYGNYLCVRSGHVVVPGGTSAESAWKDLVGASPDSPGDFVLHLLAKDKGWMAAYFDALLRVSKEQQQKLADPRRIRRLYEALRPTDSSLDATKGAFRPAPGLLVLVNLVRWEPNAEPHVAGNLAIWKEIFRQSSNSYGSRDWGKKDRLSTPEQLLEAMFSASRANADAGPLQIYLALNELDRRRPAQRPVSVDTARRLAARFDEFSDQYWVFSEFPELTDAAIIRFLDVAESLDSMPDNALRGNAMGTFQASVGLWQILARQGEISSAELDDSWLKMISSFAEIHSSAQLYNAGCNSLRELVRAAGEPEVSQDGIIELLAGPKQTRPDAKMMHRELANRQRLILDSQRLVSLDVLLALGNGLDELTRGKPVRESLITLAGKLHEFEMPRPIFTNNERNEWAAGIYNNHHTELQMRTDFSKVIKSPPTAAQLEEARGLLAPFLRDVLVGLNYAYYEPPGAQALYNNPLFVRSHDFSAETVGGIKAVWQAPRLFGEGAPAGGGAHIVGSLADLPYVLAEVEQDFISPQHVQALIWREFVPGLLTSATLPRWWNVTRNELHAVTLYQRTGEDLLTAAQNNEELRGKAMAILYDRMSPQVSGQVEQELLAGRATEVVSEVLPADTFYLAAEFSRRFPGEVGSLSEAGQELQSLVQQHPDEVSWERLSQDFGVPHPALMQTYSRQLLNLPPLPPFSGRYSRLLAESWDSGNLYWARLVDETGHSPVMLNRLVPQLTERMVEKILVTGFQDWPGLLRAMRETGEEFRKGNVASVPVKGSEYRP